MNHIDEIASLHSEIFLLTKDNESLKLLLKMLSKASNDIIANDVGNLKWIKAEKTIKQTKHQVDVLINK